MRFDTEVVPGQKCIFKGGGLTIEWTPGQKGSALASKPWTFDFGGGIFNSILDVAAGDQIELRRVILQTLQDFVDAELMRRSELGKLRRDN